MRLKRPKKFRNGTLSSDKGSQPRSCGLDTQTYRVEKAPHGGGKHSHRSTNGDSRNSGVAAITEERKPPLRALGRGHTREADGSRVAGSEGHQEAKQTRGQGPLLFAVFFCPPASQEKQRWTASHTVLQAKEVQKPT